jgi:hypothetical protein
MYAGTLFRLLNRMPEQRSGVQGFDLMKQLSEKVAGTGFEGFTLDGID